MGLSQNSKTVLATCHPDLRRLVEKAAETWNVTVLEGARTKERQAELVRTGASKTMDSKHVRIPSEAVDVAPLPLNWPRGIPISVSQQDLIRWMKRWGRWYLFVGFVLGTAKEMGIAVRSGADWNRNWEIEDQKFDDLPHFELVEAR